MNLRTFSLIVLCALVAAPVKATLFDDADKVMGDIVTGLANRADNIGAYFNLCRPSASQAAANIAQNLIDAGGKVIDGAAQANLGDAAQAGADGVGKALNAAKQIVDPNLPYAPAATWVKDNMATAKIGLSVITAVVICLITKKIFFPKTKAKHKK